MRLRDWIDIESLQIISQHVSAVVAALIAFALVGLLVKRLLPEGLISNTLETADQWVLGGLFAWFTIQLAVLLWKNRVWKGSVRSESTNIALVI